jgi:DNA-binding MarR family transcriptional regulator
MTPIAHIGKVPVEEWLPFLVPMLALYLYGRRKTRARREALEQLPQSCEELDAATINAVLARWREGGHPLSRQHLALLYPPGPDERSAGELADQLHQDRASIEALLHELEQHGYLELDEPDNFDGPQATLTAKGHELLDETEAALLESQASTANQAGARSAA